MASCSRSAPIGGELSQANPPVERRPDLTVALLGTFQIQNVPKKMEQQTPQIRVTEIWDPQFSLSDRLNPVQLARLSLVQFS